MAQRATLLHNPEAGFEQYSSDLLLQLLQRQGFDAHYTHAHHEDMARALQDPGELVVIGGGDGTVGKIAKYLVGRGIPLGILPLGTANNIAKSLNIKGTPETIIPQWNLSKKTPFDVGVVHGPQGEKFFLESIGFGLFPRLIRQRADDSKDKPSREAELRDALKHQLDILKEYKPHACTLTMNDTTITGDFLMIEIMNTPFAGPNMRLAPDAEPASGHLDVVMVKEEQKQIFSDLLHGCLKGDCNLHSLPTQRVQALHIEWHGVHYHIDDKACEDTAPIKADVHILRGALEFLTVAD